MGTKLTIILNIEIIMFKISGWHLRNRKKYLEELRTLKEEFPNHKLIEGYNQKRIIVGYFEAKGKRINFKVVYPYNFPLKNPKVYLLKNLDNITDKIEINSEHLNETNLSLCLFPNDEGSASWRIWYTAADALKKLKQLYEDHDNPELYIQEHSSEEYTFPGIPTDGIIFIPAPIYNRIKNRNIKSGLLLIYSSKDELIFWASQILGKNRTEDITVRNPWKLMINDKSKNFEIQYLFINENYAKFKENSYNFTSFIEFLEKCYDFKRKSEIYEILIIFGDMSLCLYRFEEDDLNKKANRLYFLPGKVVCIPESFFPRTIDFFHETFKEIKSKKVAIIGLGSLGSTIAYQLVKTGIEEFEFFDYDTLQPENISRHIGKITQLGMFKTDAVKEILKKINPIVYINSHTEDPFSGKSIIDFEIILPKIDLLIITTGNLESELLANNFTVSRHIPTLYCWCSGEVDMGGFFIYLPPNGACYECFLHQKENGVDRIINSSRRNHWSRLPGREPYNSPGIPGISIDIDFIGLFAARLAIQILMGNSENFKKYYSNLNANYYYWNNREEKNNIMFFGPSSFNIDKLDSCPVCVKESRSKFMLSKEKIAELIRLEREAIERDLK